MPVFKHSFQVRAPLTAVAAFHKDARALRRLSPPPLWVQLHQVEPLAEGSLADFTLWFGPLPIRWRAEHSGVDPLRGFTDTQTAGPLRSWRHTHRFERIDDHASSVFDTIEFEHQPGPAGWLSRLLFAPPALSFLFWYRGWATRRALEA